MASLGEKFTRAFTTFSGIDLTAIFDDRTVLTVSGVSCSITREKAPVYTFGSATPRSIARGKRGVAGSVVAVLFDRHAFMDLFLDPRKWYYAHRNEVNWLRNPTNAASPLRTSAKLNPNTLSTGRSGASGRTVTKKGTSDFRTVGGVGPSSATGTVQNNVNDITKFNELNQANLAKNTKIPAGQIVDGQAVTVRRAAVYVDQILPFDLTLVAQNEYGQAAWSSINACEFINEGMGMSVDDITSEQQFTFIAIHCEPWRPLDPAGKELQNVGAQTSFGIDDEGSIAVDSDAGPIDPAWAPFWSRDIDGNLKQGTGANRSVVTTATAIASKEGQFLNNKGSGGAITQNLPPT